MSQHRPSGPDGKNAKKTAGTGKKQGRRVPPGVSRTFSILYRIFRILFVPALCLASLAIGLTIGYSTIGGGDAADVFKFETWKHLYDLVFEGTS